MECLQTLLDSSTTPAFTAFLLGLLTAVSPCPLATNIAAIGFIGKDIENRRQIFLKGLLYTLGRVIAYTILGIGLILILREGASLFGVQNFIGKYGELILGPALLLIGLFMLFGNWLKLPSFGFNGSGEGLARKGGLGAFFLGMLFAMAFCPTSGVFYFGMLIPMSATATAGYLLPVLFAVATFTYKWHITGALQQKGYKVLLIDLDGQANLTESMGLSAELPQTIYGAMKGEYPLPIYQHKDGMSVVPSCLDLSAVETELINEAGRELILAHLIKESKDKYDYILIDCPPSLSLLTLNALTASDQLIIPVQAQYLAMRGMAKLMQVVSKVQQRLNSDLKIAGVLITQYDGRKNLNKSVSELVQETFQGKVFSTHIRNAIALAEAPTQGQDIFHYAPKSAGAEDYESVCNELLMGKMN